MTAETVDAIGAAARMAAALARQCGDDAHAWQEALFGDGAPCPRHGVTYAECGC